MLQPYIESATALSDKHFLTKARKQVGVLWMKKAQKQGMM